MTTIARESKEEAISRIMVGLGVDREEAEDVYNYDRAVDHDERTKYDLPPEKAAIAKKYAHAGVRTPKKPFIPNLTKRERKPNATKGGIIAELATFLTENSGFSVENVEILNKERQIAFAIGADKFELTLVQKRKPKK